MRCLRLEESKIMIGRNDKCKCVICIEKVDIIPRGNLEFILVFDEYALGSIGNVDTISLVPNFNLQV